MAVVITQPDPNEALNTFAQGATTAINERRDKGAALALATRKQNADESSEAAREKLANRAQDTTDKNAEVTRQSTQLHDKIDQADEDFKRSLDGLTRQIEEAHLQSEQVGVLDAKARLAHDLIVNKYAARLQQAGLTEAQARAHVAQVDSQYASIFAAQKVQEGKDAHAQAGASLASTEAGTNLTNIEAKNYGKGGAGAVDYGAMLDERKSLSTSAEALVEQVEQKKLTPSQAYLAAAKDPKLAKEMPKLRDILAKGGYDPIPASKDNPQTDVEKTPGFDTLPGNVQGAILRQTKQGISPKAAAQTVLDARTPEGAPAVDAPTQAKIKQVFSMAAPAAPAGAPGASPAQPAAPPAKGQYGSVSPTPPPGSANPFAFLGNAFPHAFQGYSGK